MLTYAHVCARMLTYRRQLAILSSGPVVYYYTLALLLNSKTCLLGNGVVGNGVEGHAQLADGLFIVRDDNRVPHRVEVWCTQRTLLALPVERVARVVLVEEVEPSRYSMSGASKACQELAKHVSS
jgi:hypothetical protein